MDYRIVRLDGMTLDDSEWFENFNWYNFERGEAVYTQDNDEIEADVVYYRGHTDALVFLTTN